MPATCCAPWPAARASGSCGRRPEGWRRRAGASARATACGGCSAWRPPPPATWGSATRGPSSTSPSIADAAESLLFEDPGEAQRGVHVVYTPAYEGGHPDHDAVNLAVAVLRARRPEVAAHEFPLYRRGPWGMSVQSPHAAAGTPREPFSVLALDDEALRLRRCLARANASQLLPSLLPLLGLARAAGRGRAEPARLLPAHDYTRPPHGGRLLYEHYTRRRFADFRAAALAALPRRRRPARERRAVRMHRV